MIRDKKLSIESKKTFGTEEGAASNLAKLTEEIDSVKLMVLNLKAAEAGVDISEPRPAFTRKLQ